jgi:hypothetical protein
MRRRRVVTMIVTALVAVLWMATQQLQMPTPKPTPEVKSTTPTNSKSALSVLDSLAVKGRAPKTGYARTQFGNGWATSGGCDTRERILQRDLVNTVVSDGCKVMSGLLHDPYTGKDITFTRGVDTSSAVQIDHVVALSDAWQTGAQQLTADQRQQLANDPLELLAVDGPANQQKSDGDAATWLPSNKPFRCQYVARQIAVKAKYSLWVTAAEKEAIQRVLASCPDQTTAE